MIIINKKIPGRKSVVEPLVVDEPNFNHLGLRVKVEYMQRVITGAIVAFSADEVEVAIDGAHYLAEAGRPIWLQRVRSFKFKDVQFI